jgi:hypothetical protein
MKRPSDRAIAARMGPGMVGQSIFQPGSHGAL